MDCLDDHCEVGVVVLDKPWVPRDISVALFREVIRSPRSSLEPLFVHCAVIPMRECELILHPVQKLPLAPEAGLEKNWLSGYRAITGVVVVR